ncbi:hypothetical protein EMIHUDRAFT_248536 [Emiliania huxleyi CCMP1516]|uniref:Uncharacterized protein n=2 Tax=Emiliania huxleyi TaxID=2903 RepID=A0A0D3IFS4_EMIH1|nr:hypothetical protein EMIHUDRAFT_248536 [Emiliania huxleyi CCMP1516]EOD10109.1 hypothetical protein EMIHUDRAFT_248536 [Emiliania huxleyi CCMP1516]|eukprot:XP_005762538.1 hypothetical protein EMIHUDRAFT_248536 [Emiliania huxleyi CCMP1516]
MLLLEALEAVLRCCDDNATRRAAEQQALLRRVAAKLSSALHAAGETARTTDQLARLIGVLRAAHAVGAASGWSLQRSAPCVGVVPRYERRRLLQRHKSFTCDCARCGADLSRSEEWESSLRCRCGRGWMQPEGAAESLSRVLAWDADLRGRLAAASEGGATAEVEAARLRLVQLASSDADRCRRAEQALSVAARVCGKYDEQLGDLYCTLSARRGL